MVYNNDSVCDNSITMMVCECCSVSKCSSVEGDEHCEIRAAQHCKITVMLMMVGGGDHAFM